jgi:hypothetical protein
LHKAINYAESSTKINPAWFKTIDLYKHKSYIFISKYLCINLILYICMYVCINLIYLYTIIQRHWNTYTFICILVQGMSVWISLVNIHTHTYIIQIYTNICMGNASLNESNLYTQYQYKHIFYDSKYIKSNIYHLPSNSYTSVLIYNSTHTHTYICVCVRVGTRACMYVYTAH